MRALRLKIKTAPQEKKGPPMITPEEVYNIFQETDQEKRDALICALSEEDAKYIIKCYADFLRR